MVKETERIVNISELEKMICDARTKVIAILKALEANGAVELSAALREVEVKLTECEHFDFVLERRTIRE